MTDIDYLDWVQSVRHANALPTPDLWDAWVKCVGDVVTSDTPPRESLRELAATALVLSHRTNDDAP